MYEYCECSSSDEESVYGGNIKIFGPTPIKKTKKKRKQRPNPRNEEAARLNKKLIKNLEVGPIQRAIEDALYKKDYAKYNELTKYNKQQGVQFQIASIMSSLVRLKNEYNQIIDVADSYGTNVDLKESIKTKAELSLKTINDLYNKALGLRTKGNKIDDKDKLTIKNIEEEIRRFSNNFLDLKAMGDRLKSKYSRLNPEEIEKMKEKVKEMKMEKQAESVVTSLYDLGVGSIDKIGLEEIFADPTKKKAFQNALDKKRKKSLLELKHLDELLLDLGVRVDLFREYRSSDIVTKDKSNNLNNFFDKFSEIVKESTKINKELKNKVKSKEDVVKMFSYIENDVPKLIKDSKELIKESERFANMIRDDEFKLPKSLDEIKENIILFSDNLKTLHTGINILNKQFTNIMTSFYDKLSNKAKGNLKITNDDYNNYPFLKDDMFGYSFDKTPYKLKYSQAKNLKPKDRPRKELISDPNKARIAEAYKNIVSDLLKEINNLVYSFKKFKEDFKSSKGTRAVEVYTDQFPILNDEYNDLNDYYQYCLKIYNFLDDFRNTIENKIETEKLEEARKKAELEAKKKAELEAKKKKAELEAKKKAELEAKKKAELEAEKKKVNTIYDGVKKKIDEELNKLVGDFTKIMPSIPKDILDGGVKKTFNSITSQINTLTYNINENLKNYMSDVIDKNKLNELNDKEINEIDQLIEQFELYIEDLKTEYYKSPIGSPKPSSPIVYNTELNKLKKEIDNNYDYAITGYNVLFGKFEIDAEELGKTLTNNIESIMKLLNSLIQKINSKYDEIKNNEDYNVYREGKFKSYKKELYDTISKLHDLFYNKIKNQAEYVVNLYDNQSFDNMVNYYLNHLNNSFEEILVFFTNAFNIIPNGNKIERVPINIEIPEFIKIPQHISDKKISKSTEILKQVKDIVKFYKNTVEYHDFVFGEIKKDMISLFEHFYSKKKRKVNKKNRIIEEELKIFKETKPENKLEEKLLEILKDVPLSYQKEEFDMPEYIKGPEDDPKSTYYNVVRTGLGIKVDEVLDAKSINDKLNLAKSIINKIDFSKINSEVVKNINGVLKLTKEAYKKIYEIYNVFYNKFKVKIFNKYTDKFLKDEPEKEIRFAKNISYKDISDSEIKELNQKKYDEKIIEEAKNTIFKLRGRLVESFDAIFKYINHIGPSDEAKAEIMNLLNKNNSSVDDGLRNTFKQKMAHIIKKYGKVTQYNQKITELKKLAQEARNKRTTYYLDILNQINSFERLKKEKEEKARINAEKQKAAKKSRKNRRKSKGTPKKPKGKGYTPAQLEIKKQVKRIKLNKRMKPQTKINKLLVLKEMI